MLWRLFILFIVVDGIRQYISDINKPSSEDKESIPTAESLKPRKKLGNDINRTCSNCHTPVPRPQIFIRPYRNAQLFYAAEWVYSLGIYYPTSDPAHDRYSDLLLSLKDHSESVITAFADFVATELPYVLDASYSLCAVPSSSRNGGLSPMAELLGKLAAKGGAVNVTSCLYRSESITPAHRGGKRSVALHHRTIGIQNVHLIRGRQILLFDDIYTSGASMQACCEILQKAGATSVSGIVLGRTQRSR